MFLTEMYCAEHAVSGGYPNDTLPKASRKPVGTANTTRVSSSAGPKGMNYERCIKNLPQQALQGWYVAAEGQLCLAYKTGFSIPNFSTIGFHVNAVGHMTIASMTDSTTEFERGSLSKQGRFADPKVCICQQRKARSKELVVSSHINSSQYIGALLV